MSHMVSMELDDDAKVDMVMPISAPERPDYPYGLCISLTHDEIRKLGIDIEEATVGGVFHFEALGKITSLSMTDRENAEPMCRMEVQITDLGIVGPNGEEPAKRSMRELYKT